MSRKRARSASLDRAADQSDDSIDHSTNLSMNSTIHSTSSSPSTELSTNQSCETSTNRSADNVLVKYAFLVPSLLKFLTDCDVLCRLVLVNRSLKQPCMNYRCRTLVTQMNSGSVRNPDRYLPVVITRANDVCWSDGKLVLCDHGFEPLPSSFQLTSCAWHSRLGDLIDLQSSMLPSSLTCLDLHLRGTIAPGVLPASLTYLALALSTPDESPLLPVAIPFGVKHLRLGHDDRFHSRLVVGSVPSSVTHLILHRAVFRHDVGPGVLPDSITHLTLSVQEHTKVVRGVIPSSVTHIQFGHLAVFFPFLPGLLPPDVKCVSFDEFYRPPMQPGALPSSVTHLKLGLGTLYECLPWEIPSSVTHLELGLNWTNHIISAILCPSVLYLKLGSDYIEPIESELFPSSLTDLSFGSDFNQPLLLGVFPASLTRLSFGKRFNQPLLPGVLPASLTRLELGAEYDQPFMSGCLPVGLTHLTLLSESFKQIVSCEWIPCALTHLDLFELEHVDTSVFPAHITHLRVRQILYPGQCHVPHTITHLTLPKLYRWPSHIPPNVVAIELFEHSIDDGLHIPDTVKQVVYHEYYPYDTNLDHVTVRCIPNVPATSEFNWEEEWEYLYNWGRHFRPRRPIPSEFWK